MLSRLFSKLSLPVALAGFYLALLALGCSLLWSFRSEAAAPTPLTPPGLSPPPAAKKGGLLNVTRQILGLQPR